MHRAHFEHNVDLRESSARGVKGGEKGAHYRFAVRARSLHYEFAIHVQRSQNRLLL
jgi:hypothetical protein